MSNRLGTSYQPKGELRSPTPQEAQGRELLEARILAGAIVRCASCSSWVGRNKIASTSLFFPWDGSEATAYTVCKRCWKKAHESTEEADKFVDRIETYLTGDVKHPGA